MGLVQQLGGVLRWMMEGKINSLDLVFLSFAAYTMLSEGTAEALFDRTGGYCLCLLVMTLLARLGAELLGPMVFLNLFLNFYFVFY